MELVRSSLSIPSGLPCVTVRSAPATVVSGPAQRSLALWPARSRSRHATLYTEGSDSFVASAAASIATGWSEPVPGREFHPLKSSAFSRRTVTTAIRRHFGFVSSLHLLDVVELPGPVEKCLLRAVETEDGEPAFAGDRGQPVLTLAGRLRAEVDVGGAVRILHRLIHRIQ